MTTVNPQVNPLTRAWRSDKPLTLVGLSMVVVLLAAIVGIFVDPAVITGQPAWLKPAKFAISVAIYSFTFVWLLTFITGHRRLVRAIAAITAVMFVVEMVLIIGAAAMDTTSHFNVGTTASLIVWETMGTAIVVIWVANVIAGVLLLRQRMTDRPFAWGLRMGVIGSAVGMGVAFFMTAPTAQQLTQARSGHGLPISGAHSVGVEDGGAGLPVLGWSTVGGDLRVGHFIGLHALQALPIFAFLLARFAPAWLRPADRVRLVITAGLTYIAIIGLATWQALRAQPLIHPDALTLSALAAVLIVAGGAAVVVVRRARGINAGTATGPTANASDAMRAERVTA